jgi:hypothetical protein
MKAYLLKSRVSGENVHGFLIIVVRSLASQKNYARQTRKRKARRERWLINFFGSSLIVIASLNLDAVVRGLISAPHLTVIGRHSPGAPGWCSGTLIYRNNPCKMALSSRITLIGTVFDGIPEIFTVPADPGIRLLPVVYICMTA